MVVAAYRHPAEWSTTEVSLDGGGTLIALDPLGCNEGEAVLITQGSVAAAYFTKIKAPIDALIIGSIDEKS